MRADSIARAPNRARGMLLSMARGMARARARARALGMAQALDQVGRRAQAVSGLWVLGHWEAGLSGRPPGAGARPEIWQL